MFGRVGERARPETASSLDDLDVIDGGDVVLIEDDDSDAERIGRFLSQTGGAWEVRRATTLHQGLELLAAHGPDVVLLDLTLPDARGLETISAVLDHAPRCPVVVQSDDGDESMTIDALRLGAQDYLRKQDMTAVSLERALRYAVARHRARCRLEAAAVEIADRDAELGDFAHVVAHDLRAPLRTARLLADRLLDRVESDDPLTNELGTRLDESLSRVDTMILSMLDYAGLRGEFPDPEPVSPHWVVHEVRASLEADLLASEANVLMPLDPKIRVSGNVELLERVFVNLLGNSLKYRRPDERLNIRFGMHADDNWVTVSLADNGLGIPRADRDRVFDILSRLNPGVAPGLGFGLAICRRIVKGLGGEIWIEPSDGAGTTVCVRLRRAPDIGDIQL